MLTIFIIAVALSMDAMAVSMVAGIKIKKLLPRHVLKTGAFFGLFQTGMTWLGMLAGSFLASFIEHFDHWVAFGLLVFVGGKMIHEAIRDEKDEKDEEKPVDAEGNEKKNKKKMTEKGSKEAIPVQPKEKGEKNPFDTKLLFLLAIATSLDALAVGLSFAFLRSPWLIPGLIIGIVTFVLSCLAVALGKKMGDLLGNKMEILGGLILIGIGLKILWDGLA